jgi:hypothetical protein
LQQNILAETISTSTPERNLMSPPVTIQEPTMRPEDPLPVTNVGPEEVALDMRQSPPQLIHTYFTQSTGTTSVVTLVVSTEGIVLGAMPEMPEQRMDNMKETGKSGMEKAPKEALNLVASTTSKRVGSGDSKTNSKRTGPKKRSEHLTKPSNSEKRNSSTSTMSPSKGHLTLKKPRSLPNMRNHRTPSV